MANTINIVKTVHYTARGVIYAQIEVYLMIINHITRSVKMFIQA